MSENIGYIRIATVDQNTERQLLNVELEKSLTDKCSGKDTERAALKKLINYDREGDVVLIANVRYVAFLTVASIRKCIPNVKNVSSTILAV